ncbi:MAG: hypothetical protein KC414_14745 [Romboutsia sp.]|nr:hypothetical protein [Romboutsia sp.]
MGAIVVIDRVDNFMVGFGFNEISELSNISNVKSSRKFTKIFNNTSELLEYIVNSYVQFKNFDFAILPGANRHTLGGTHNLIHYCSFNDKINDFPSKYFVRSVATPTFFIQNATEEELDVLRLKLKLMG